MDIRIKPNKITGTVAAIPSKSDAHRKLICAALSDKYTEMSLPLISKDIAATVGCLRALGADIEIRGTRVTVRPIAKTPERAQLDCGESGSTLRFILPVAAALGVTADVCGSGRLPERPISELTEALREHGISFSAAKLPFTMSGKLTAGDFEIAGDISSQYITGLMLGLTHLAADSTITLKSELKSAGYIDITTKAITDFGGRITRTETGFSVRGGGYKTKGECDIDGDWSNSAFFLASGALGESVTVTGLDTLSPQGDKAVLDIIKKFGAEVKTGACITASPSCLNAQTVDIDPIPDSLPILAVLATGAVGTTRFINGARLRLKESDRLKTTADMINALGGDAVETPDGLTVRGVGELSGGSVDSVNDHRIVMAAAIASVISRGDIIIRGAEAAEKSYPTFFEDLARLGGKYNVI